MPTSRLLLALPLSLFACADPPPDKKVLAKVEQEQREEAVEDGLVACATGGETVLRRACSVDRVNDDSGLILIVRHPDGGFRRLRVTDDGRGVVAADGAEAAQVAIVDKGEIEVRLAGDVYRLPATVEAGGTPAR